jgi:hypothetical protein
VSKTVHATLHQDQKLSKKSARLLPELTDQEMKKERVRMCESFIVMITAIP